MIEIGTELTLGDFEALESSWIDRANAEKAVLRRVTSIEGAEIVGRRDGHDYAGIIFPYVWPGDVHPREYRLRRDSPDVTYEKGEKKSIRKYLSPPGRGNLLYFMPVRPRNCWMIRLSPLLLPKAKRNASRFGAWLGTRSQTLQKDPISCRWPFQAFWNWRGTVGKETGPNGKRVDVKGVIPDFSRIIWASRKVVIAFDSDVKTNDNVRAARRELARHLIHERGALVYFLGIPELP